ncbi:MAG TPA: apolipoprotein N-acyltransferase [Alphaproteobacteria bacterium]|nr:apolipoprotein N-acyltransferase [Alphaproteobacteria bacterium]HAJ48612.1 apolipoprotein N-acyltransferase [Alphaproteobacteria bacterium]
MVVKLRALNRRVRELKSWRAGAVAFLAGVVSALAMAPFHFWLVLPFTLGMALWLVDGAGQCEKPIRAAAWRGWTFGFGYFLAGIYWVGYAFLVNPNAHAWLLPFVAVLFPGGLALFFVFSFVLAHLVASPGAFRAAGFALAVSAGEWLRGHMFTGFPWNLFGYTWSDSIWLMQPAALFGIYALSLLTVLAFVLPATLFSRAGRLDPAWWRACVTSVVLIGTGAAYGAWRVPAAPSPIHAGEVVRIVQPNVPQNEKWQREHLSRNWLRLIAPLGQGLTPGGKPPYTVAIWPEAAPPFILAEQPEALEAIGSVLPPGTRLISGSVQRRDGASGGMDYYNGIDIIGDDGKVVESYQKSHLVPFGEYLPLAPLLERLGITKLTGGQGGFKSGSGVRSITLSPQSTIGPLICYEIVFSRAVVDRARRPDWLVNLTDDSWFGPSSGPYQHLGIARLRAVEEGLAVVRAANTGVSAIIDPYGRVVASIPLGTVGLLQAAVPQKLPQTLYAHGGELVYGLLMVVLAGLIGGGRWGLLQGQGSNRMHH